MGTSGSFTGSGGKDARDLRDNVAEWLDGFDESPSSEDEDSSADSVFPRSLPDDLVNNQSPFDLGPVLRLLLRPRGRGGSSDGPGAGGGGTGSGTGGRSSGGPARSVGRVSRATGRAGRLALAYSSGNRDVLREAGLNYDELKALGDPLDIGIKIVEVAFGVQSNSTVADAEERSIVAEVVEWILEHPGDRPPTPEEVVRKSIETTIAQIALTEVAATIHSTSSSHQKRHNVERGILDVAAVYAAQARLTSTGATEQEMAQAIEEGIRGIGEIFGVTS